MKYDVHLVFIMIAFGLAWRKPGWRGWFAIGLLILGWMILNLVKH